MVKISQSRGHSTETERASSNFQHVSVSCRAQSLPIEVKKTQLIRVYVLKETSLTVVLNFITP